MSLDPDTVTVTQAKEWLRERLSEGEKCPCCAQLAKIYKRKLNSGMARMLIHIYRATRDTNPVDGWLHVSKVFEAQGIAATDYEYSKLRFWGLLEQCAGPSPVSGSPGSGLWRITEGGTDFVRGRLRVPKHVFLYDNRVMKRPPDTKDELTDIRHALGDKFNYDELMGGV